MSKLMVMSFYCVDLRAILYPYPIHFGVNECIMNVRIVNLVYSDFYAVIGEFGMPFLI